jgi:hypothetical protein
VLIEVLAATSCKAAFPLMGSAWALCVCEGMWSVAAVAAPAVVVLGIFARDYPGRLRGKRGGSPP